tara:strand:- start:192 stop:452 length:261 start_codon:yes stop_codon:yes gene_type:complete
MTNKLFITANGFDEAILGIASDPLTDKSRVVYDYEKCVAILQEQAQLDAMAANEFMRDHMIKIKMGDDTPLFVNTMSGTELFGTIH